MTTQQPISIYTSVAFLLAAGIVWFISPSVPFIFTSTLVGVASIGFHATGSVLNMFWHRLDEFSIYALLAALLYHAYDEPLWLLALSIIALLFIIPRLNMIDLFRIVPAVGLLIVIGIAVTAGLFQAGLAAVAALIAGYVRLRLPDTDWWHGVWHVLAAGTTLLAWWFTQI